MAVGAESPGSAGILDELHWRELIAQSTDLDALAAEAAQGPITLYAGFDPTAPSLHAGHLVPLLALRRFQRAGHRPIVLAGGATGLIGDPRDTGERVLNAAETVQGWTERIRGQLERFVDFDSSPTGAIVENNLEWTGAMSAIELLRDVGKHFSVNVMLDRDTVRRRLEGEGISYTEFSYMLLQANDYVELHQRHHCVLQIGGSDQWGNIIAGVRLVRQKLSASVHALTVPLVTAADGTKFGKSTGGGNVWLDPEMTTPYAWYQYFVNTADADVIRYLRWFTFLSADELTELDEATASRPHERAAQRRLARELTTLVHGEHATESVEHASQALFGRGELDPVGRVDAHGRAARDLGSGAEARFAGRDRRPAGRQRAIAEQRRRATHDRRGRGVREQREGRRRGVGTSADRFPAWTLAGLAAGQAEYCRGRARSLILRQPNTPSSRLFDSAFALA